MDEHKTLYRNFLENKSIYNLNVSYWRIKLQKSLEKKISNEEQLLKNKDINGKNYYDGNPIFSFYDTKTDRAIRIIQEDPQELLEHKNIGLIEAWIDKIVISSENKEDEVPELVISLYLTRTSVVTCISLANKWFKGSLNSDNLAQELN